MIRSAVILLAALSGCVQQAPRKAEKSQHEIMHRIDLETVTKTVIEKRLETRVYDSLQQIAREHVEKHRLLELPGLISDLPRRLPGLTVENDYRITTLDRAIESFRILMTGKEKNLNAIQSGTEKRKIAVEQAVCWSKLDYIKRIREAGIDTLNLKNTERDIKLELTITHGLPRRMTENFDFATLPDPREIKKQPLPGTIAAVLKSYKGSPETALRFAEIVYRLPAELLQRNDGDFSELLSLVEAVGSAINTEILYKYMTDAGKSFIRAEKLIKQNGSVPELVQELERARLAWRLAYFKLHYHQMPYPANPDNREVIFLTDLVSLQAK